MAGGGVTQVLTRGDPVPGVPLGSQHWSTRIRNGIPIPGRDMGPEIGVPPHPRRDMGPDWGIPQKGPGTRVWERDKELDWSSPLLPGEQTENVTLSHPLDANGNNTDLALTCRRLA